MNAFVIRRLLGAIPLLLGVSVLSFIFMQLAPGGPDTLLAKNGRMTQAQLAAIRHNLGLDEPVHVQLWKWIVNLAQGDLGTSFTQQRPVRDVIFEVFPNTVYLMVVALAISLLIAMIIGIGGAINQYGWFDNVTSFLAYFGLSMPVFWFGLMLQILFAVKLGWLPSAGMHSATGSGAWDLIKHMVMPATTLAIGSVGSWSRYLRSSTLEIMGKDYVRTARAKGLRERVVMIRHVLRNAMIPFLTVVAIDIPLYLTGAVVTETVFSWPGMGRLFFDSLTKRDYPVLMGILLLGAVLIVIGNLLADVLYAVLDPRISLK
ncbi:MAG TPA: ABC transporter permease [Thermomicrobiales bacterium]|jgi:peptide/nickel transport system permease protein|nr:ABC transporter permease [Thermomicrobiales bacterium]